MELKWMGSSVFCAMYKIIQLTIRFLPVSFPFASDISKPLTLSKMANESEHYRGGYKDLFSFLVVCFFFQCFCTNVF